MGYRQDCFNQFLLFLHDPQAHPHPQFTLNDPVLLDLPDKEFMHVVSTIEDIRETTIKIMESALFRGGMLRGNQNTQDQPINNLEEMVLELGAIIKIFETIPGFSDAPWQLNFDYLCGKFIASFDEAAEIMRERGLIRKDVLANTRKSLIELNTKALNKAYLGEIGDFDLVAHAIRIFLNHVGSAPDNLIASHIYDLVEKFQPTSGLIKLYPPEKDTMRKRVKAFRISINTSKI